MTEMEKALTMERSIDQLVAALAKAQAGMKSVTRDREVEVKTDRGGYKFKYATLDAIIDHVRKPLTDNGLWFTQTLTNGGEKYKLVTTLLHVSGQTLVSETPLLVERTGNQAFGSSLTYMRRYALSAMLGICADDDDDANAADGNTITKREDKPQKAADPKKDFWGGPLSKTDLKEQIRTFHTDLESCDDYDSLTSLLSKSKSLLNQCAKDQPTWWSTQPGSDVRGLHDRIEDRKEELSLTERV